MKSTYVIMGLLDRSLTTWNIDVTTQITLPLTYGQDAIDRCLDIGTEVRRTKRTIVLDCTQEQLSEIKSDASYYADPLGFDEWVQKTICPSARLALARLNKLQ